MRRTVLWKLLLAYAAIVAVVTTAALSVLESNVQPELDARLEHDLHAQAVLLRGVVADALAAAAPTGGGLGTAGRDRILALGRDIGAWLCVADPAGGALADSSGRLQPGEEVVAEAASVPGEGRTERRYSAVLGGPAVVVVLPVTAGERRLGFVRVARRAHEAAPMAAWVRRGVTVAVVLVGVVSCGLAYLVLRWRTARLRAVTGVAEAMAAGDHSRRVEPMGDDEVGTLARAVNAMAGELGNRLETITKERTEVLTILKSMVEGVVAVDRGQRVVLINDEARRILGIGPGRVAGRPVWAVTRMRVVGDLLDQVIQGEEEARDEISLPMRGGDHWLELHSAPLRDEARRVVGAVLVLHDITGLRRLEQVRRDFVTNVSHELKTPLTAIRGFVETLLDDADADPDVQYRFLCKIRDHTHRLSALVADLLTLSRVESQGVRPEGEVIDVRESVRSSYALMTQRAEAKGLRLALEMPPQPVLVRGDSEMLRQVADNLLDNAIKYTPAGGRISVRLAEQDGEGGGRAVFEVQDTGVGLEPKDRQRVFERFYRVDRARSRELGGTGLGLSIVKHVVLAHDGEVSVDSTPGRGSTFRVLLPLSVVTGDEDGGAREVPERDAG